MGYKTNDYQCTCGAVKKDEMVKNDEVVTCDCGKEMTKCVSAPNLGGMDSQGSSGNGILPQ